MAELIVAVACAILISSACSLMEAVLYSVPTRYVESLTQKGKPAARLFKSLRSTIERPIAAILSLNTIANTAGAAFAGSAASAVFGHQWLPHFSLAFTLAILLFSEIIPKTAGVVYGRRLLGIVAYALRGLVWIMAPAIWLSNTITGMIARGKDREVVTPDELRIMATLSLRSGQIRPYQERAIESILDLQHKTAKEVMTPRTVMVSLSEHLTLKEAAAKETIREHSRIPVYDRDEEDVVGFVLTREIYMNLAQGRGDMKLTDLMRPIHFVAETAPLDSVLMDFLERREHLFVVLDEYGGISGLITLEDILEEVIGREIVDEFDEVEDKRELARKRRRRVVPGY